MGNISPMVWMPCEGNIHKPSSERSRILPKRPRKRDKGVSATLTPRLRKHCRVILNAHKVAGTLVKPHFSLRFYRGPRLLVIACRILINTLTAALDEDQQHHHKSDRADDSNQSYVIHLLILLFYDQVKESTFPSLPTAKSPRGPVPPGRWMGR